MIDLFSTFRMIHENFRKFTPEQPPFQLGEFRYGYMIHYYYDIYVSSSLIVYGEWAQSEIEFLCSLLDEGDTVVDVGAFIGTHTLPFARKVGITGNVYAFEPIKGSYYCLTGNINLNNLYKIDAFQLALSKNNEPIEMMYLDPSIPANFGGCTNINFLKHNNYESCLAYTATLDSFNLSSCKLIKIDAEGMSLDILQGSLKTIEKCMPFILAEIDEKKPDETYCIIDLLKSFDYNCYLYSPSLYNPDNFFNSKNSLFKKFKSVELFCCPENFEVDKLQRIF